MTIAPIWKFREMHKADTNVDPVSTEFFTTEALAGLSDALLREVVQNALDAGLPGATVRVRFDLRGVTRPLDGEAGSKYLAELHPHLTAPGSGLADPPAETAPMEYLVIEDFGTRGLTGDPNQYEDIPTDEAGGDKNHFYYFFRNIGRSAKGEHDRGRWGLGKTVLPASSRANAFVGLTVQNGLGRRLLMGQCMLKIHKVGDTRYCPYGFLACFDTDGFQQPITNDSWINEFASDFQLNRVEQSGLTLVIPFPRQEVRADDLLRSAIQHFYVPILARALEVQVVDSERDMLLSVETLRDAARRLDWSDARIDVDSLLGLFDFAEWAIFILQDGAEVVVLNSATPSLRWDESLLPAGSAEALRTRFEAGEDLAFRVPLQVQKVDEQPEDSFFSVVLKRDEGLPEGRSHFLREGLTITELAKNRTRSVCGIVFVNDRALSQMLGDSENPAHTDWRPRSSKLASRYRNAERTIRFVKESILRLSQILSRAAEGRDPSVLADYLHYDLEGQPTTPGATPVVTRRRRRHQPPPPGPLPPPPPSPFVVAKVAGGFRISRNPGAEFRPLRIRAKMAYHTRVGNPFRRYNRLDFDLSANILQVEHRGVTVLEREGNILLFTTDAPDFEVRVTGFDQRRDVRVSTLGKPVTDDK